MMFVSIGLGVAIAVALIAVVSLFTSGPAKSTGVTPPVNAMVGKSVGGFRLAGLNGGTIVAPYEQGHPTVLVFFASWCDPCKAEMPRIATFLRQHHEGSVKVIGVDTNDPLGDGRTFVRASGVDFPVVVDSSATVSGSIFQLPGLPDTVFVNGRGVVTQVNVGAISNATLARDIRALRNV